MFDLPVVAATLLLVSQRYASTFGRNKNDLRFGVKQAGVISKGSDKDGRADDTGAVHLLLSFKRRLLQRLGGKESGCNDYNVDVRNRLRVKKIEQLLPRIWSSDVDSRNVGKIFGCRTKASVTSMRKNVQENLVIQ
jgi:hypothetical protein